MVMVHLYATWHTVRRSRQLGASRLAAAAWGLVGFITVPAAALFLTGLLGDFAANWISSPRTIQNASLAFFPTSIITMWSYQLAYWHFTRHQDRTRSVT